MAVVARFGPQNTTAGGSMTGYPFSDPLFQNFTAQQYVTTGSGQATYSEVAPEEPAKEVPEPETNVQRKARLRRELAALKAKEAELTEDEKARVLVVDAALKNGKKK